MHTNPYIGPRSFQTGEKIYGRDRELKDLLGLLIAERIVLLNSPSGAGKTSLINAGLIPALQEREFAVLPTMRVSLEPPAEYGSEGNRYIRSLLLSLEEGLPPEQQAKPEELAHFSFDAYLKRYMALSEQSSDLVLIFDQFEEILTVNPTDTEAKHEFFTQLGEALRNQRKRWALFSMREDYVASLQPYLRPVPTRLNTTFHLGLLDFNAARAPIQQPARAHGVDFTDDAARQLIDDLRRVQVQLPNGEVELQLGPTVEPVQLQVVCRRLWEQLFPGSSTASKGATPGAEADPAGEPTALPTITPAELSAVGDVDQALSAYYADQVQVIAAQLTGNSDANSMERAIREWFDRQLITTNGVRGQVLQGPETSGGLVNQAIWPLINAYLVRAEKRRGLNWFELSHDRMISPVRSDNEIWFKDRLSTLQRQADLWNRSGRPEGLLLLKDELSAAEEWASKNEALLLSHEREFLQECRKARAIVERAARQARRIRNLAIGASILSVLATIAFVVALIFYNQAVTQTRFATARGLAANALGVLTSDPEQSVILARAAVGATYNYGLPPGPDALDALHAAVQRSRVRNTLNLEKKLYSVAYQPNGNQYAISGVEGIIQLWDPAQQQQTALEGHDTDVFAAVFSADGSRLASTDLVGVVIVWDVASGAEAQRLSLGEGNLALSIDLSNDNRYLAAAGIDGVAYLFDLTSQTQVLTITHNQYLTSVDISPDSNTLLTVTGNGDVALWEISSGKQLYSYPHGAVLIPAARFSPDGSKFATIDNTGALRIWAVDQPAEPQSILRGTATALAALNYSPDGQYVAIGIADGTIQIWDVQINQLLLTLSGHDAQVTGVSFANGQQWLASSSNDGTARIWTLERIFSTGGTSVVFSNTGDLAMGSVDGSIRLIDGATGQMRKHLRHHTLDVNDLRFTSDGKHLLAASSDGTASVWSMEALDQPVLIYDKHQTGATEGEVVDALRSVAINPAGDLVATAGQQGIVQLWQLANGETVRTFAQAEATQINNLMFSPVTGTRLAASNVSGELIIWDVNNGQALHTIAVEAQIGSLVFSRDESQLLVGTDGGELKIYNVQNGSLVETWKLHTGSVSGISYSPDGNYMATVSADSTLKIYNKSFTDALLSIRDAGALSDVAYSPDGTLIATVGIDGGLDLYPIMPQNPLNPDPLLAVAQQRVTRPLTGEECRVYRLGIEDGCQPNQ
jgi:WD40 repeat protein